MPKVKFSLQRPASAVTRQDAVSFHSKYIEGDRPWHPSAFALNSDTRARAATVSEHSPDSAGTQARQPLTQRNDTASVSPQKATTSYDELLSEADALLRKLKSVQPIQTTEQDDLAAALAAKRQQAAARNRLAIVRVRVRICCSGRNDLCP